MELERPLTDGEARALARLGAAAAAGDDGRLRAAFPDVLAHRPADDVEELLLQIYLFAGFPRTINAFFVWQGWAANSGIARGERGIGPADLEEWRARGEELCRVIYGSNFEALQGRLGRLHPALAEWTLVEGYGKVLSRPGPDAGRREIAAIGALVALGAERQLRAHLQGAVHAGAAPPAVAAASRAAAAESGREDLVERLLAELGWSAA